MTKKFSDDIYFSDSKIRGIVSLYKDGKFLFTKENTIVNAGRKYLQQCFLRNFLLDEDETKESLTFDYFSEEEKYILDGIELGTGIGTTTSSYNKNNFQSITKTVNEIKTKAYYKRYSEISNSMQIDLENKKITFSCHFDGDEEAPANVTELAIFLKKVGNETTIKNSDNDSSERELFSRLSFDSVSIGIDSSFDLEYSIYF